MEISQLKLQNFRSYESLELQFNPGVNVLFGLNGQGKTNLLEALYLCTAARSHRTAKDSDLVHYDRNHYSVFVAFKVDELSQYQETLEIAYHKAVQGFQSKRAERSIQHDGMVLPRVADLMGIFHAVMFAPEDLSLIKDGPGARRRFLDILISQLRPLYFVQLQRLQTILSQRNTLLKNLQTPPYQSSTSDYLEVWNLQLAQVSAEIIKMRYEYCQRISNIANMFHHNISDEKEALNIRYRTRSSLDPSMTKEELTEQLVRALSEEMDQDIRRGFTSIGPHRDDLVVKLNERDLKVFGSQGQQRTAVLALKLAELRIIQSDTNESPILLLDDVMSELDRYRRHALVQVIQDCQIFITCTDPEQVVQDWSAESRAQLSLYEVAQGEVKPVISGGCVV